MRNDDAYANGAYIADADSYPKRWSEKAEAFRTSTRCELDQPYGDKDRETYDLFLPEGTPEGVVIFIHGGYWKAFDKSYWSHLAAGPLAHGWQVAMPSYTLAPDARISDITRQVGKAIAQISERAKGPIRLVGHSAGGHLAARLAGQNGVVKSVAISPVSDLRPLLDTTMNEVLGLSLAEAVRESPALHAAPSTPVHVWVGAEERPAFIEQARWLSTAWDSPLTIAKDLHHFDVIDALADLESDLTKTVLDL